MQVPTVKTNKKMAILKKSTKDLLLFPVLGLPLPGVLDGKVLISGGAIQVAMYLGT
jgi:hypothetical protein